GRLAPLSHAHRARQHLPDAAAGKVARAQPGRKYLAVHPRKLALQPRLRLLPRHSRPLLLRLEQAHRSALAHNFHRLARLGPSVMIGEAWYWRSNRSKEDAMPQTRKIYAHPDREAIRAVFASNATDRSELDAALDRGRTDRQQRVDQLAAIEQSDP